MKWITRERPKIDRIACPWLIARFIDPAPEFLYVPAADVLRIAAQSGATPYDVPGVEFGHHGEHCSFDAFVERYRLDDPALVKLARIVRAADCDRLDLAPEAIGSAGSVDGAVAQFPGRPPDAAPRHGALRRAVCVVRRASGRGGRPLAGIRLALHTRAGTHSPGESTHGYPRQADRGTHSLGVRPGPPPFGGLLQPGNLARARALSGAAPHRHRRHEMHGRAHQPAGGDRHAARHRPAFPQSGGNVRPGLAPPRRGAGEPRAVAWWRKGGAC